MERTRQDLDNRILKIETEEKAYAALKKEFEQRVKREVSLREESEAMVKRLESEIKELRSQNNTATDSISDSIDQKLAPVLDLVRQTAEKLEKGIQANQAATELRLQTQLRNMLEKIRDEIGGQLREIEREQIRRSDIENQSQFFFGKLDSTSKSIEELNSILNVMVDQFARINRRDQEPFMISPEMIKLESSEVQERSLLDTMEEIGRIRRTIRNQ